MKAIILTVLLSLSLNSAYASQVKLQKGDVAVTTITSGKIVNVVTGFNPNCPINALCSPVTEVTIEFPLNGCLDRLGPVASNIKFNNVSGKYDITVSTSNISTKMSMVARCIKMPTAFATLRTAPFLDKEDFNLIILK